MKHLLLVVTLCITALSFAQKDNYIRVDLDPPRSAEKVHLRNNGYLLIFDRHEFLGKNNEDFAPYVNAYDTLDLNVIRSSDIDLFRFLEKQANSCLEGGHALVITPKMRRLSSILMDVGESRGRFGAPAQVFLNPIDEKPILRYSVYPWASGGCPSF
ncbi:MAG: hypothetical protein A3D92_14035 [Bacteroidetes bacterium RIFCSPHIGHO2_02_FULL_44_7]|nr:MAG: hypothetical protein A3D92_14035 [Bacteroidetes bacterium RIFCSPHIGHO2_02_FULL_44_7]